MPATTLLSRSKQSFIDIPSASEHVSAPSERMGLLSHTLAPSPVVRWILPARIRSRGHNDVVFVGSTYIQLREFHAHGQLSDTTAKLDIGTQILGAKVISAKSQMVPTRDEILDQGWDEPRFFIKGAACNDEQPPQIVVLVTATSELIYVYGINVPHEHRVELRFAKRALLHDVTMPEQHLNLMAIDPECKIMAVASRSILTVFSLRDVDDLKESIDAWDPHRPQSFQPNHEQRMLQIDGTILRMEFIRATAEEPEKTLLLLVVINNGITHLLMYRWDTRETLDQIHALGGVPELRPEENFPLMIIPSFKRNSFIMVTEALVIFYDELRSERFRRILISVQSEPSIKKPLWVQWARPTRHDQYLNRHEDILLVREDGLLRLFTRMIEPAGPSASNFSPGVVNMGVDSAMCMLPQPRYMSGDILIVGGSMGDGGVFHLKPRQPYEKLQTIPNASPIRDMLLLQPTLLKQRINRSYRTFVTAGASGSSNLNELHFGQEAQIGWQILHPEAETVNRLWTLEHSATKRLYILSSHLEHTTLMAQDLSTFQLEQIDPDQSMGFHLVDPTLAAEVLDSKICVQITKKNVVVGCGSTTGIESPIDQCVCACIDVGGTFGIACKVENGYQIEVGLVRNSDGQPLITLSTMPYLLTARPTCLAVFNLDSKQYLCAGREDGQIEIFVIGAEGQLSLESILQPNNRDVSPISSIVAIAHSATAGAILLAGSRQGTLKVLRTVSKTPQDSAKIDFAVDRVYQIGLTPVTVVQEHNNSGSKSSAWVVCGSRIDRVMCFKYESHIDYMLTSVWLTMPNKPTYVIPNLSAVQRVPYLDSVSGGDPSRFLVCVTNTEIVFASLIEEEQMIPQRLGPSEEGARPIGYSDFLRKFVIASDPVGNSISTDQPVETHKRFPTLQVVDPDGAENEPRDTYRVVLGGEEERVTVLLPWSPTDGKTHYNLIMVGLSGGSHSRLGMVTAKKLRPEHNSAILKSLMKFRSKQFHAICDFGLSSLVLGVGRDLILIHLNLTTRRWHEDGRLTLPSPAVSLSAQGSMIYAATQQHSTIILKWHKSAKQFEKILNDRVARNARVIHPFGKGGDHALVATSSGQGTCILAYSLKPNDLGASIPLFEADLPEGIERVKSIPTAWTESSQYAFQAITFDGAVSIFQTLTNNQWKLLRFVEQMASPDPWKPSRRTATILTERMSRAGPSTSREGRVSPFNPTKMHIHGDILKRLVDKGPQHLCSLFGPQIKNEDDMDVDSTPNSAMIKLEALAKPVIGDVSDVPTAVIVWIRKLLRATIF